MSLESVSLENEILDENNKEKDTSSLLGVETVLSTTAQNESPLKYQGRKTARSNSELRRRAILESALRIVVREGVRAVRHRAVAKEANVPLSATTYYFKDINDLITDTFTLFVEMSTDHFKAKWRQTDEALAQALQYYDGESNSSRALFVDRVTNAVTEYIMAQLQDCPDYLIAEQAFQLECLNNPQLRMIAGTHHTGLKACLEMFFQLLESDTPDIDADLFISAMATASYQSMTRRRQLDSEQIYSILRRQLAALVATL